MKRIIAFLLLAVLAVLAAACGSNANTVSDNISKEAEKFHIARKIVVMNSITDRAVYAVQGVCSFTDKGRRLDVICKDGPNRFYKTSIGLGDNTTWTSTQLGTVNVSQYRTKIIIRPTSIVPDLDLVTGDAAK